MEKFDDSRSQAILAEAVGLLQKGEYARAEEAARLAGYSPQGARQRGSVLMANSDVRLRVEEFRRDWMAERDVAVELEREHRALVRQRGNPGARERREVGGRVGPADSREADHPELAEPLDPDLPTTGAEVVWAARYEMARAVEDVLARRSRALFLDARAAVRMAPAVARLLAGELGQGEAWQRGQVHAFNQLAMHYWIDPA